VKTMKNTITLKLIAFLLCSLFILYGSAACIVDPAKSQEGGTVNTNSNRGEISVTSATETTCPRTVSRIVLLQDKSGSTNQTRTPQTSMEHIDLLINFIRPCGGELSYGLVNEQSNASLLRLRIELPPSGAPNKPDEKGNPFIVSQQMEAYRQELSRYEGRVRDWRAESERRIADFKSQIGTLLSSPASARRTDIFGGIQRANLFLSESSAVWTNPTHQYLILVSDGEDNVRRSYTPLNDNVKFILVNGSASIGSLGALNPERFESIESAIRFVVASERDVVARAAP